MRDYLEDCPNPHADVGGNNVHQAKASKAFKLLDVQLQKM
jgi:hypothetical protein